MEQYTDAINEVRVSDMTTLTTSSLLQHNTNRPQTTILSLPREIRDAILSQLLVAHVPIVVWWGKRPGNYWQGQSMWMRDQNDKCRQYRRETQDLRRSTFNLIMSNSMIGHEAAQMFYQKNKFAFVADWTWDMVHEWLRKIGSRNRCSLSTLELVMGRPSLPMQFPNGEREPTEGYEPTFPRNPHLAPGPKAAGYVENINPAVEDCIKLLCKSDADDTAILTLKIVTCDSDFTLFPVQNSSASNNSDWYMSDLPNLMERFRSIYTTEKNRRLRIFWVGMSVDVDFDFERQRPVIEESWDIIEVEKMASREGLIFSWIYFQGKCPIIRYKLRRKELAGKLVAARPTLNK